jgi:hypothetical protein
VQALLGYHLFVYVSFSFHNFGKFGEFEPATRFLWQATMQHLPNHYDPVALEQHVRVWESEKKLQEARALVAERRARAEDALAEARSKKREQQAEAHDWFQRLAPAQRRVCRYIICQRVKTDRVQLKEQYGQQALAKFKRSTEFKQAVMQLATKEAKTRLEAHKKNQSRMALFKAFREYVGHMDFSDNGKAITVKNFSNLLFRHDSDLLWSALAED